MHARALVLLNAATSHAPDRDATQFESAEIIGEGADWVSAKNACAIPDGGLLLAWFRED